MYARVRPLLPREREDGTAPVLDADLSARVIAVSTLGATKPLRFQFDAVLPSTAGQEDAFGLIQPQLQSCLKGYNVTVFACVKRTSVRKLQLTTAELQVHSEPHHHSPSHCDPTDMGKHPLEKRTRCWEWMCGD